MKFPVIIRQRREKATIYGKSPGYDFYRLGYYVARQQRVRSFKNYAEAKAATGICQKRADQHRQHRENPSQQRFRFSGWQGCLIHIR